MRIPSKLLVMAALALTIACVCASSAVAAGSECSTCGPWWRLTSGSRPTNLQTGIARDEVQTITVGPSTAFELKVNGVTVGTFATEPFAKAFGLPEPTSANVQTVLESVYGSGDVIVTGGAGSPLTVTNVNGSGMQTVAPVDAKPIFGGGVRVAVVVAGQPDGKIVVTASNLGDANIDGAAAPVVIADKLPPGLRAVAVEGEAGQSPTQSDGSLVCSVASVSCSFAGTLPPFDQIEMLVQVVVEAGASTSNEVSVRGGGAPDARLARPLSVGGELTPFGVEDYALSPEGEGGATVTQAGAHPFQLTTSLALNKEVGPLPAALVKDLNFKWPPGLIGNPTSIPRCTIAQFLTVDLEELEHGSAEGVDVCPAQAAVGVTMVTVYEPGVGTHSILRFVVPLFNLEPAVGEPARFGFYVPLGAAPVIIDTAVRTGGDYGITVSVHNVAQTIAFISTETTVWGVPGDPRHDAQRGWACLQAARGINHLHSCGAQEESKPPPLLSLPTSCTGPLQTSVEADSWIQPGTWGSYPGEAMPAMDGCNRLPFGPEIKVAADGQQASKPSGLTVDAHVPQEGTLNGAGLANSNIKDIAVTLPEGVVLNPAGADGLEACSEGLVGYLPGESTPPSDLHFTPKLSGSVGSGEALEPGRNFCPDASKVATVKIKTPLLPNPLEGAVYLATQNENPFGSLIAMYIVAEDPISGSLVKLPGKVTLNQTTGQIESTFENTPQLAFEDAELHFFGGERAPLATPAHCGTYTTNATFTPWSGDPAVHSSSSFQITSGPNGTACPGAALPFSPTLTAETVNNQAGSFSPFTLTMSREDGQQSLKSIQLHMPAGLSGVLTGIPLCGEAQANTGTCPTASLLGETTVSVGLGGDPFSVKGGQVFLTGPYRGAPFGLSIVNPAVAGPFNLGKVIVRAKLEVDPHTAAVTVTSDESGPYAIPPSIDGIPLQIKHVNVTIGRPGFMFNPTNCTPTAVTGTLDSIEGDSSSLSVPFQATNCAVLKFAPKFAVSTSGRTSKANGASLNVKLSYPQAPFGTQANITRVKVDLPKALPSRLTTLQKACTNAQFEANPAGCPAASIIGHAKATTPLIAVPLEGPAYFVSHGGEAFPSLIMVLQGYGVTLDLVGTTFISKQGITSSTFKTVPDAPVGSFELNLPQGKFSALAANGNLCTSKLAMPTEFLAQNGAKINESTPVSVTGCAKAKAPTREQKLVAALKACKKKAKGKRTSCGTKARKQYGPVKTKQKTEGKKKA
jgi:hypothetical protein